jgi:hypothetical protein
LRTSGKRRDFWINLHYAVVGITVRGDVVTDAPPLARWMVGKSLLDIKPWLVQRKAKVIEIFPAVE